MAGDEIAEFAFPSAAKARRRGVRKLEGWSRERRLGGRRELGGLGDTAGRCIVVIL